MGGGIYSYEASVSYSTSLKTKAPSEIFSRSFNNAMCPFEVLLRESRDSDEHPESFPIILALDVTGSMGTIPVHLVKNDFPVIMKNIMDSGIKDPQILFMGVGDHECDRAPLQVGQFESSDTLLNKWLTDLWLESGGGGNEGESYFLPWYFTRNTVTDHMEKRGQKGVLITIGDEPVLKEISKRDLDVIFGGQNQNYTAAELLELAGEKYHVFHIHMNNTRAGSLPQVINGWKQLMGDKVRFADSKESVAGVIVSIIREVYAEQSNGRPLTSQAAPEPHTENLNTEPEVPSVERPKIRF